jgi:hypothetical protein
MDLKRLIKGEEGQASIGYPFFFLCTVPVLIVPMHMLLSALGWIGVLDWRGWAVVLGGNGWATLLGGKAEEGWFVAFWAVFLFDFLVMCMIGLGTIVHLELVVFPELRDGEGG